jgi:hypothetical protein
MQMLLTHEELTLQGSNDAIVDGCFGKKDKYFDAGQNL